MCKLRRRELGLHKRCSHTKIDKWPLERLPRRPLAATLTPAAPVVGPVSMISGGAATLDTLITTGKLDVGDGVYLFNASSPSRGGCGRYHLE